MGECEGSEGSGRGGIALNLPHQQINDVEISHGEYEIDHPQIENGARGATALGKIKGLMVKIWPSTKQTAAINLVSIVT